MIDISQAATVALQVVSGGLGTWGATELVKLAKYVPVNEGQAGRIRAVAAFFAALSTVLFGAVDGTLQSADVQNVAVMAIGFAATWGVSHVTHVVSRKKE